MDMVWILMPLLWIVSLYSSHATFGTLKDWTLHEWLSYHTLISMRAFDQWSFWQLLGVSLVGSRSYEWENFDVREIWKGEGLYLSYPSLWLDIPYILFKLLHLDINIPNLHAYALVTNRFICSLIIFLLYNEICQLIINSDDSRDQKDSSFGQVSQIPALIGTAAWLFTPPVLYWTQNVYFTDQAVVPLVSALLLFTVKIKYRLHEMTKWQKVLLLVLTILATGYDWYAWTFLVALLAVYLILNWDIDWKQKLHSLLPILTGWVIVIATFLVQLFYFKDGIPQLLNTPVERSFLYGDTAKIKDSWETMLREYVHYLPSSKMPVLVGIGLITIISISLTIKQISQHERERRGVILATILLMCFVPWLHNLILANHSYIHNFSVFKLSVAFTFIYVVIPLSVIWIYLPKALYKARYYLLAVFLVVCLGFGIYIAPARMFEFSGYPKASNFSEQLGNLIRQEFQRNHILFAAQLYIPAFPPNGLWYANRRVYDVRYFKPTIELFKLADKPVEYYLIDRKGEDMADKVCVPNSIKEKTLNVTFGDSTNVVEEIITCSIDMTSSIIN
ncbi:MAG: hypothetical protein ACK4QL_06410 [Pseudanabaenaceae cyanobacterium]